jgi:hypothetical protein
MGAERESLRPAHAMCTGERARGGVSKHTATAATRSTAVERSSAELPHDHRSHSLSPDSLSKAQTHKLQKGAAGLAIMRSDSFSNFSQSSSPMASSPGATSSASAFKHVAREKRVGNMGAAKAGATSAQPPAPGPPASAQGIREKIRTKGKKMVWNAVERVRDSSVAVTRVLRAQADPVEWSINKQMTGHTDGIWDIAVCRWENKEAFCHETMLASASADRTGRIWAVESGREVATLVGHKGSVNSICFHPYEALVCTASGDKSCNVWRLPHMAGQENQLCDRDLDLPAPSSSVRSSRCRCLRPVLGTIVF